MLIFFQQMIDILNQQVVCFFMNNFVLELGDSLFFITARPFVSIAKKLCQVLVLKYLYVLLILKQLYPQSWNEHLFLTAQQEGSFIYSERNHISTSHQIIRLNSIIFERGCQKWNVQ